ncbi:hypothetical protein QQ045_028925 [Rhodiola kirilowii]
MTPYAITAIETTSIMRVLTQLLHVFFIVFSPKISRTKKNSDSSSGCHVARPPEESERLHNQDADSETAGERNGNRERGAVQGSQKHAVETVGTASAN